jgi:hypothetical protein
VLAGEATSRPGWDGEYGPFFTGTGVNYARVTRSDYTLHALTGAVRPDLLQRVDAIEQIARMDGLIDCVRQVHAKLGLRRGVSDTPLRLIVAEKIANWSTQTGRFDAVLTGEGYRYVFARLGPERPQDAAGWATVDPQDIRRCHRRLAAAGRIECQFTKTQLVFKIDGEKTVRPRAFPS